MSHCQIQLFADATCLYIEVDNRDRAAALANEDLSVIDDWAKQWLVTFSPLKTKSLLISNKKDSQMNPPIYFGGHLIEEVTLHVHLGVCIASNLRWNHHIHDITLKATKRLNLMVPLKFKLDRKSLEVMYNAFVLPIMEYGNVVWGVHTTLILLS